MEKDMESYRERWKRVNLQKDKVNINTKATIKKQEKWKREESEK